MSDPDDARLGSLRVLAESAGLKLSEDDAARLLSGFERNRVTAAKLRGLISPELEPASVFSAFQPADSKE